MAEAQQTTNPIRLLFLALNIKESLDKALELDPENVEARLDRVRWLVTSPGMIGGDVGDARAEAKEIAKRDPALGHFANGYIAYREKEYGPARRELHEARKIGSGQTKALATRWLGWLSQETQQWPDAFALFEELGDGYEIGRTAAFCSCELERGKAALEKVVRAAPKNANGHYQLALVSEKLGDLATAKREVDAAYRLDRTIAGVKQARERITTSASRRRAPSRR